MGPFIYALQYRTNRNLERSRREGGKEAERSRREEKRQSVVDEGQRGKITTFLGTNLEKLRECFPAKLLFSLRKSPYLPLSGTLLNLVPLFLFTPRPLVSDGCVYREVIKYFKGLLKYVFSYAFMNIYIYLHTLKFYILPDSRRTISI
jgi:hypothetical protein